MTDASPSACILIIGNEILSGKTQDKNIKFLGEELAKKGISLKEARILVDEKKEIVSAVNECRYKYTYVITTGGIGPTHDDVTASGVAMALDVSLERHPELEAILRGHFGERLTEAHLKMADMPEGTSLFHGGGIRWPVLEPTPGLYMLPGIPEIFRDKIDALRSRLRGEPMTCRWVFTRMEEGQLAPHLVCDWEDPC